jgi:hypothetical protein
MPEDSIPAVSCGGGTVAVQHIEDAEKVQFIPGNLADLKVT